MSRRRDVRVWQGDEDALKAFAYIESTGFRSPRKDDDKKGESEGMRVRERLKFFNKERAFGFTESGVFIHIDQVVAGEPVEGASVVFDVEETPKGLRGINVRVKR